MAPHVGLNIVLLSYIGIGAMIFIWLEAETELSIRRNKLKQILNIYQLIHPQLDAFLYCVFVDS